MSSFKKDQYFVRALLQKSRAKSWPDLFGKDSYLEKSPIFVGLISWYVQNMLSAGEANVTAQLPAFRNSPPVAPDLYGPGEFFVC